MVRGEPVRRNYWRRFRIRAAYNEACGAACEIEDYLIKTPASGPIGLAIKVFLRHKDEHQGGSRGGDPCKLCVPVKGERDGIVDDVEESLLRDAVRSLPELAPLCAAVIEERAESDAKTPAIYDFDAIGKTPAPVRPDLPALFEELKLIVREFDAADEENDKAHWEALSNRLVKKSLD